MLAALAALLATAVALRFAAAPGELGAPRDALEWSLRGLRAASGAAVGASLALAGVLLQCLLRNPLAEPATLGLTTGAGLGVTLFTYAHYLATGAIARYDSPAAAATAGSLAALAIVGLLARRRTGLDPVSLILTGVVVSLTCGAGIVLVQHLLPDRGVAMGARWVTGALSDETSWGWALGVLTLASLAAASTSALASALDAASLGEDEARSVGVPLGALRLGLFLGSGLLTAGAVMLAGPIGFIGLVAPHLTRILVGPGHRALAPAAAMLGAALVVAADAAVKLVDLGAGRMPIGVITAILGGPVFLALLRTEVRAR